MANSLALALFERERSENRARNGRAFFGVINEQWRILQMNKIQFAVLGFLLGLIVFAVAEERKPTLSPTPLTAEQIAVYQAFVNSYSNGSKSRHLNLANRTYSLDLSEDKGDDACLKGIQFDNAEHPNFIFHRFDPQTSPTGNITLVDPDEQAKTIKKNDPSRTMREGKSVDNAVQDAFATGLLSLSEVAFDKTHQFAIMSFGFRCGGLCGHGETIVFQRVDGQWKRTKRQCGTWIS
jgi:hypothetical protein